MAGGIIVNVDEVVAALRPALEACYIRALAQEGRFGAWIILHAQVIADGSVRSVEGKGDESVSHAMMTCLRQVVTQARFAPPMGGDATVSIPLTFTVQAAPATPVAPPQPQPPPATPQPVAPQAEPTSPPQP